MTERPGFVDATTTGAGYTLVTGGALLYGLSLAGLVEFPDARLTGLTPLLDWTARNLGLSLPVFAVVALLFARSLATLGRRLGERAPPDRVAQAEHLTDIWISLFFGVGVIWTAVGMRGALLFALGDPGQTQAGGAFAVLQRMVDGGILHALSTTIFGGVGGYLMRIVKTTTVGGDLKRYYESARREPDEALRASLASIERRVASLSGSEREPADE